MLNEAGKYITCSRLSLELRFYLKCCNRIVHIYREEKILVLMETACPFGVIGNDISCYTFIIRSFLCCITYHLIYLALPIITQSDTSYVNSVRYY